MFWAVVLSEGVNELTEVIESGWTAWSEGVELSFTDSDGVNEVNESSSPSSSSSPVVSVGGRSAKTPRLILWMCPPACSRRRHCPAAALSMSSS